MENRKLDLAEATVQANSAFEANSSFDRDQVLTKLQSLADDLNKVYNNFSSVVIEDGTTLSITLANNGKKFEIRPSQTVSRQLLSKYISVIVSISQDVSNFELYAKEMGTVFNARTRIPEIREMLAKEGLECDIEISKRGVKISPRNAKNYYVRIENGNLSFTINDRFTQFEIGEIDEFAKKMKKLEDELVKFGSWH